jgi:hypothetical protein
MIFNPDTHFTQPISFRIEYVCSHSIIIGENIYIYTVFHKSQNQPKIRLVKWESEKNAMTICNTNSLQNICI